MKYPDISKAVEQEILASYDKLYRLAFSYVKNEQDAMDCFSDGTCMLTDEPAEYKLKMEIGTLTTLLLGYKTAERLYALERIEGKQEAVDRLDDVLFHKIPYISDYI